MAEDEKPVPLEIRLNGSKETGSCPAPCCWETVNPVTVPRKASIGLELGKRASGDSVMLTVLTEPVKFSRFTAP